MLVTMVINEWRAQVGLLLSLIADIDTIFNVMNIKNFTVYKAL